MKTSKILTAGILAACALVTTASADYTILITGSTAFRPVANTQIRTLLGVGAAVAFDDADETKANAQLWITGATPNKITVKAAWTGSAGGIQAVAAKGLGGVTTKFLQDTAVGLTTDPNNGGAVFSNQTADICFADNLQTSTPFVAGSAINGGANTYESLTDNQVGVVSFTWAASKNFPAGKNMTKQIAKALFGGGAVPLGVFTGLDADQKTSLHNPSAVVYATGRNPDSGTRITALAESGFGINNFVYQYKPSTTATNITNLTAYPTEIINGVTTTIDGNSGENTGKVLRNYLPLVMTAAGFTGATLPNGEAGPSFMLTYLAQNDFNSVAANAVALTWEGVSFSQLGIMNGSYTFWGYEHIMWRSSLGTGTDPAAKLTFANNLMNNILGLSSAALSPHVKLGDMVVSRPGDGGDIQNLLF